MLKRLLLSLFLTSWASQSGFLAPVARADLWTYPWLLEREKMPLSLLNCPNALSAGSCGNGRCDPWETASSCPYDCSDAPIKNWNADLVCGQGAEVIVATSVVQLQRVIKSAAQRRRHLRVVGARHSDNGLLCSSDLLLDLSLFTGILGLSSDRHAHKIVTARAGTKLYDLMTWLHQRGYKLKGYAVPAYREGTVAGILATASHGGSLKHPANMADIVNSIEMVTTQGERKIYSAETVSPAAWRAARASLGLLGVVTTVSFEVEADHNLQVDVASYSEAALLAGPIPEGIQVGDCDWDLYYWRPQSHQVKRICAVETDAKADSNIANTSIKNGLLSGAALADLIYLTALSYSVCDQGVRCVVNNLGTSDQLFKGYFTRASGGPDEGGISHFVGLSPQVLTSASGDLHTVAFRTYELTFAQSMIAPALAAIASYVETHPCGLLGDISIRFGRLSSETFIGPNAKTPDPSAFARGDYVMHLEINNYSPTGLSDAAQRDYNSFTDDLVRLMIDRYEARPHWGKGQSWVLRYAARAGVYGDNLAPFRGEVRRADPEGLMVNPLARAILDSVR